jgi:hypothetical protein
MRQRSPFAFACAALCLTVAVSCSDVPKRERTGTTGGESGENGGESGKGSEAPGGQSGSGMPGVGGTGGTSGVGGAIIPGGGVGGTSSVGGISGSGGSTKIGDASAPDAAGGKGGSSAPMDAGALKDMGSTTGAGGSSGAKVTYEDLHPFFMKKCGNGCHEVGAAPAGLYHTLATSYADAKKPAGSCPGMTVGACTLVRIKLGQMPSGAGCSPNPGTGVCVTAAERDMLQSWISAGLPEK